MADRVATVELPADASTSVEARRFVGFPGVYTPGVPVPLSELRVSELEARDLIDEQGLPLVVHGALGGRVTKDDLLERAGELGIEEASSSNTKAELEALIAAAETTGSGDEGGNSDEGGSG